jgi:hypothetical protein
LTWPCRGSPEAVPPGGRPPASGTRCFTTALKKNDEVSGHVSTLVEEVRAALSELWDELNAA